MKMKEKDTYPQTKGKTENFFTAHVKLITFFACIAVLLLVAFQIYRVKYPLEFLPKPRDGYDWTVQKVIELSKQKDISLATVKNFKGVETLVENDVTQEKRIRFEATVSDDYLLRGYADPKTEKFYYFVVFNNETGEYVSLLDGDVQAFFTNENAKGKTE